MGEKRQAKPPKARLSSSRFYAVLAARMTPATSAALLLIVLQKTPIWSLFS